MRPKRGAASSRKSGCSREVAHERALARAAEAGHAVLHVGEEALAGLLAVVADVDARVDLRGDARRGRRRDRWLELVARSTGSPRLRRPWSSARPPAEAGCPRES